MFEQTDKKTSAFAEKKYREKKFAPCRVTDKAKSDVKRRFELLNVDDKAKFDDSRALTPSSRNDFEIENILEAAMKAVWRFFNERMLKHKKIIRNL